MNKAEFERGFTALYFALAAHTGKDGLVVRAGEAFAEDGKGVMLLAGDATLHVSVEQIEAYLEADVLTQQTILSKLAREAYAAIEQSRAEAPG